MKRFASLIAAVAGAAALTLTLTPQQAAACGCLSPPVPESVGDFAVNQQSEQIIFEAPGDGTVTAHVLIKYAGAPEKFAWLVPIPSVPDLALSESVAFALIDQATAPNVAISTVNLCPDPEYICQQHAIPSCDPSRAANSGTSADTSTAGSFADASSAPGDSLPGGVEVLQSQQIGSYETVVFSAEEATGTVTWLRDNGFIVNDTMTPFMQPYLDAGMLFIAAKLVPGADVSEIRPLKMTYEHPRPIIPLKLTAVAAEPHLTITSYIFGDSAFQPLDHPLAIIDETRISRDDTGRSNYPMVLSRTIDEQGRDAFVAEFRGQPPAFLSSTDFSGCCSQGDDWCGIGGDGVCQCPRMDFDAPDCDTTAPGLTDSIKLLDDLGQRYEWLTRLTTRLSPEEMSFDPQFEPVEGAEAMGRLSLNGVRHSLDACSADVIDPDEHRAIEERSACSATYCGTGECVVTVAGAGCRCTGNQVARTFTDLDGQPSVTCLPREALVNLGADVEVPSSCAGVTLTNGSCVDVGGFPSSDCQNTSAGVLVGGAPTPACLETKVGTGSPGAEDFSAALDALRVCAPMPDSCGPAGWLVPNPRISRAGVSCQENQPSAERFVVPPEPRCDGDTVVYGMEAQAVDAREDDGCQGGGAPTSGLLALLIAGVLVVRRRLVPGR